ncbi:MAG: hypothetical protein R3C56_09170 [Pirellulaceae bacterium]
MPEKTSTEVDLLQSIEHLEIAQQNRHKILADEPSEKIRFEIAKGDFVLGSTLYATQFVGSSSENPKAKLITQHSIEEAFLRAEAGLASLSDSTLYSLESRESQAIALRELSVLGLGEQQTSTDNFQKRIVQVEKSRQILTDLCFANPLVQKYEIELLETKACLYRIARFKAAADTLSDSPVVFDELLQNAMLRDLNQSRKLAMDNPSAFMKSYLSLAKETCLTLLQVNAESDALHVCVDAKTLFNQEGQSESSPLLAPLIEFMELAIAELHPFN